MHIEIMDTTLRDGEQTSGVAFAPTEKLSIAKVLLEEVKVDRLEIASARISQGEYEGVVKIVDWAAQRGYLYRLEVLGFVDHTHSVDWIHRTGVKVLNLLCKGSLRHLEGQLRKNPEQHIQNICETLRYAKSKDIEVNVYLEDWSNGMKSSPTYVFELMDALSREDILRFMLPDTLGILNPLNMGMYMKEMVARYPKLHFDTHTHNDYELAVANALVAIESGAKGVHATVNGLGERAGNASLSSIVAGLRDQLTRAIQVDESKLIKISRLVEAFSGIRIPSNKPIDGENVFTQTCGVHADGDSKGDLYVSELSPERFGRSRKYALGKTSGKASIKKNLEELGIELNLEQMSMVTQRVVELGDKKKDITTEDLPYIIADVLGSEVSQEKIKILNYHISSVYQLKPTATLKIEIDGELYEEAAVGDGQYDAFMKALKLIYKRVGKEIPVLLDYTVRIPPGGSTDALAEAVITWSAAKEFKTRGLDSDQTLAAIKATMKMLNIIENHSSYRNKVED